MHGETAFVEIRTDFRADESRRSSYKAELHQVSVKMSAPPAPATKIIICMGMQKLPDVWQGGNPILPCARALNEARCGF